MTKIAIKKEGLDSVSQYNFTQLREVINGRISIDNMQGQLVSGVTSDTANTEKLFRHSFNSIPVAWLPVTGNVFVESLNSTTIDVRSESTDTPFTIFIIK